jgi:hypothetical protein
MRQRWLGATGRKVPEIAVEGELEFPEDSLVLDDTSDLEQLRKAHDQGLPVLVHASTPEGVRIALTRPEVSSVLVPAEHPELLDIDLTALTYG